MATLCIADPPYLGRATRWYGGGRGSGGGRHHAPDVHPAAATWDYASTHTELVAQLDREYDGWAIAATAASLTTYLAAAPDARVLIWNITNAAPSGSRIHTTWEPVIRKLAKRYTVIAPDLLGHGQSAKPRADYSVGGYANGMRDLLTVLNIDKVTVVGHSLGGGVAMQFAYQFPERTERMVLVAPGGLGPEVTPMIRAPVRARAARPRSLSAFIVSATRTCGCGVDTLTTAPAAPRSEL